MTFNQINEIKQNLINKNNTNNNTIIKTENIIIQFSKLEDQKNSDDIEVSNIDFGECENLLKNSNNLSMDESLIVFKTDIKTEDSSTSYVEYEVYHPYTLAKLNLSICYNTTISISVPVILEDNIELLVKSIGDSDYNIFDGNDSFYNDICSTYTSQNGTDMLLSDRKKDIYSLVQSQYLCQSGCEIQSYNSTSKKATCDCSIKLKSLQNLEINDLFDKKEISQSFYKTLANSNFHVLKCYKLIIDFSKILNNKGQIMMTILFFVYLILIIAYFIKEQQQIKWKQKEIQI